MIQKDVNLFLNDRYHTERLKVSQFDTMWQWRFTIYYNNTIWSLPSPASAVLNGKKPDGNVFAFLGTINGNVITVNADVQMTAVAGDVECELSIIHTDQNAVVGTANFILDVEAAPKAPTDISSDSTLPAYEELLRVAAGLPDNIPQYITNWLDQHPEATTTVQDGAITYVKLHSDLAGYLDNKVEPDGAYPELISGHSDELIGDPTYTNADPYTFRHAPSGDYEYNKLIGGTVAWNQLVGSSDTTITVKNGHKYYSIIGGTKAIAQSSGAAISVTGGTDIVIDLTQAFGSTIADYIYSLEQANTGSGVAWFRKYFPNDYYANDPGSLQSVNVSAHKTTGFNLWDEVWRNGYYDKNTGAFHNTNDQITNRYPIKVLPNTEYFISALGGSRVVYLNANKSVISIETKNNLPFTTPANCRYINFNTFTTYGTSYNNDICVNLSNPAKNGTYEPYTCRTYPLDATKQLRGIPKLVDGKLAYDGDIYTSEGKIQRKYGIVDLGTLTWSRQSNNNIHSFQADDSSFKCSGDNAIAGNLITANYTTLPWSSVTTQANNKSIATRGTTDGRIAIQDNSYSDAATFKSAMSGVYLVYELAAPTEESAQKFTSPQMVSAGGMEEYVDAGVTATTPTRDVTIPVGHETQYAQRYKNTINLLLSDIPNTKQSYVFTDGVISSVLHKQGTNTIRTDTFTFSDTTVVEIRSLANNAGVLTLTTDLSTLETDIVYNGG